VVLSEIIDRITSLPAFQELRQRTAGV
jgi:hypothetical protein